jgi:peptidoglycan/LPS O-acetylase OafA/YrhL
MLAAMGDRRNNFDALRLCAALSVVVTHAFLLGEDSLDHDPLMRLTGGQCPLGVAGVFVFFIISGFLVTGSWEATRSVPRFLMKRALRIYPGLALCLVLLAFVLGPAATSLPPGDYLADPGGYLYVAANLLMNVDVNSLPAVRFTDFAAGQVVDGPLWSLPNEVLMYLMVAALGGLGLVRAGVIGVLMAAGLVGVVLDTSAGNALPGQALWLLPFFASGMALYKLRAAPILRGRYALVALAGLGASIPLNLFIFGFAVFGGYLVIYLAFAGRIVIPATRFGDLSYGLYIYGWPVQQVVVRALGGAAPWWQVLALALPVVLVLAALSWRLVEAPALTLKRAKVGAVPAIAA